MTPLRFTLPTAYGPATFTVTLGPEGEPLLPRPPLAELPDAAFKLSYGADWAQVRRYFQELTRLLAYGLPVYRGAASPPDPLRPVIAQLPAVDDPSPAGAFWRANPELTGVFDPGEPERRRALARFAGRRNAELARRAAPYLFDYLAFLTGAESLRVVPEAYQALGALGSVEARDFLLGQLSLDGRHPYTRHLLTALRSFPDKTVLDQVWQQYRGSHLAEEELPALLDLLGAYTGAPATEYVTDLLRDHAYLVDRIARTLRQLGLPEGDVVERITAQFYRETEYAYLDDLLRAANAVRAGSIDLRAMNDCAADDLFVDVPPVNWPQQLESGWSELTRQTPMPEATEILASYLARPEPRLQRNALLQLKVLTAREDFAGNLPADVEARLAELIGSRYDKVYVEVLNLLARRELRWHHPLQLVERILQKSLHTRYRTVILKALRTVGNFPEARLATRAFYLERIRAADASLDLEHLSALLPYLEKYLGDIRELRDAIRLREDRA